MDMDVIQEFSENQCYLNALSSANKTLVGPLKVAPTTTEDVQCARRTETMVNVLSEPLGRMFLRAHLRSVDCTQYLMCLDSIEEYTCLPVSKFRKRHADRIIRQFLLPESKMVLGVPHRMRSAIIKLYREQGAIDGLFDRLQHSIIDTVEMSLFLSFVESKYYRRLLGFRNHERTPIHRDDFTFIRILGEGGFGKVFAVSKNDTRALYACKTMSKERIAHKKREKLVMNERNILAQMDHPFIVGLQYAFQDDQNLYLLLDLMPGGELGFHLSKIGRMHEDAVRFYAAGIVLALEYFHKNNIVYRDLKPENIMLDSEGYIRLTDLGLCARLDDGKALKQHCGTRSYMAPEQCYGETSYSESVDWWSLGVTVYFLMCGSNPFSRRHRRRKLHKSKSKMSLKRSASGFKSTRTFGFGAPSLHPSGDDTKAGTDKVPKLGVGDDDRHDHRKQETHEQRTARYAQLAYMYEQIVAEFQWPEYFSDSCKDLCKRLINMDRDKRLGATGADEIKQHPFFDGINWERLMARHVSPPFIPNRDFVNAKFHESASMAFTANKKKAAPRNFPDWEFTRPKVYQVEIMQVLHDKNALLGD
jgi:serine/threonine protein kinase